MTVRTPTYLKGRFENDDVPLQTDFEDVFDSFLAVGVTAEQTLYAIRPTDISSPLVSATNLTAVSATVTRLGVTTVSAESVYTSAMYYSTVDVSANTTVQATGTVLNGLAHFVTYANGQNNAVTLPASTKGRVQQVINASTTTIKIFPAVSARFLVTAVNASLNLLADRIATIYHKGDDRYGIQIG